ncbi:DUF2470 domain-containing protein [Streptomyces sp. NPDC058045]|uniref:DUF2470 domain-containing protein n=1 Tax=Streptomyces sp. NPDC058045 TaxID=3346311 RepID=UPI0036E544B5
MRLFDVPASRPSPAERVRSALAAAASMTLVTPEGRTEVLPAQATEPTDRMRLRPLLPPAALPATDGTPATLEITDIAPLPLRHRVRARVSVTGLLYTEADGPRSERRMEFGQAVLDCGGVTTKVSGAELAAAAADPLATSEAGMLTHLADQHEEVVPLLMRLVEPEHRQGVVRAVPAALDRYGITLRLEYVRGHCEARLPFAHRLDTADQTGVEIHALLLAARHAVQRRPARPYRVPSGPLRPLD